MKERIDENHPWVTDDDIIVTLSTSTMFVFIPMTCDPKLLTVICGMRKRHVDKTYMNEIFLEQEINNTKNQSINR